MFFPKTYYGTMNLFPQNPKSIAIPKQSITLADYGCFSKSEIFGKHSNKFSNTNSMYKKIYTKQPSENFGF